MSNATCYNNFLTGECPRKNLQKNNRLSKRVCRNGLTGESPDAQVSYQNKIMTMNSKSFRKEQLLVKYLIPIFIELWAE